MKFQDCESELEKARKQPNLLEESSRLESQLKSRAESRLSAGGENKAEVIRTLHELDIKIQGLYQIVARSKEECLEKIAADIENLNHRFIEAVKTPMEEVEQHEEKLLKKVHNMAQTNSVFQITRKLKLQGTEWLLLEKKNPLGKQSLLEKSKSSSSSLSEKPGKRLFWVKASSLSEEQMQYLYKFTPKTMLEHDDMLLSLSDLMTEEETAKHGDNAESVRLLDSIFTDLF